MNFLSTVSKRRKVGFASLLMLLISTAFSKAPDNVVGFVYSQVTHIFLAGSGQSHRREEILLRENATYVGLLSRLMVGGNPETYSFPSDGRWEYRKTGETTAELTIDGVVKILRFDTNTTGSLPPLSLVTEATFSLVTYDLITPLTNCSNRSFLRAGGTVFTGFVTTSPSRGRILVRAVGPGLVQFGVSGAIRRPVITVRGGVPNTQVAINNGWSDNATILAANTKVAAFSLGVGSSDAAAVFFVEPGAYIAEVTSADPTESGEVLIEVYMLP